MRKYLLLHVLIISFVFLSTTIVHAGEEPYTQKPHITLRTTYTALSVSQVQSIPNVSINRNHIWGFNGHSTINHSYEKKTINGDNVVIDYATGLMWHQSGYEKYIMWKRVKKWLQELNKKSYAGYHNWRLPTVEEAASLLKSGKNNDDLYIDAIFDKKQRVIWTGDKYDSDGVWLSSFLTGDMSWSNIVSYGMDITYGVRPVRSITGGEVTVTTPEQDKTQADPGTVSTADSSVSQLPSSLDEPFIPPNEENLADFITQLGLASSKLNETDEEQLTGAIEFLAFCIGANLLEENEDEYEKMTDLDATAKLMVKLYRFAQKNGASMTLRKYIELADEFRKQKSNRE